MSGVGTRGSGEDYYTVVRPEAWHAGSSSAFFLSRDSSEIVLVKKGEDALTHLVVELNFGSNRQEDRLCIWGEMEEPSQGKLEAPAGSLWIQTRPVSFSRPQETNKTKGRIWAEGGGKIEHIRIHLLVLSVKTQLKLQELTRPM